MASQRPGETRQAPVKPGGQTQRGGTLMDTTQHPAAPVRRHPLPVGVPQRCCNAVAGNCPENSFIVREALRMNLPRHLVFKNVQRRIQTHGSNYTDIKELVADLFTASKDQEVPMETNQLELALMMNSEVVKEALQIGVPHHVIKPKLRDKLLSDRVGYTDVSELLKDLNCK